MNFLRWENDQYISTAVINRPPANALASDLIREVDGWLDAVEHDENVRVLLIHGEGRFFSAGADIKEFTQIDSGAEFSRLAEKGQQVFERMEAFSKPIIASIHGAALGGGLELAMGCHIRYVSETAKLGLPELQLGLVPGFAGSQRLPRFVGFAKAAEMLLTSDPITGTEAVQWGLANKAFPEDEVLEKSKALASKLAGKSPVSVKAALELLQYSKTADFHEGVAREAAIFGDVFVSEDAKEGISAFIEKRQPEFKGQ
ncbi:enoyl-CoA hydratase [Jeotgalibacillus haloalkalitolerans]|uniref:Enoyl-CoA hydratase n=1 Tax=Jeotgalibacillus haloalkalitolerans TaxID=3104292 RepID=A0ABU5KMB6_9BACL|nr:enoyl-CoA hydratase [Jeotgalibacillus sp. HH7-29]MDZ5712407.1 enoyl-CoA hydratase [Jeotgalibacillus sp. HH7-29]